MDFHVPSKIKNFCGFVLILMNSYLSCCNEGTHHEIDCLMHFVLNRKSKNFSKQTEIADSETEEEAEESNQLEENFMCSLCDIISDITPKGNVIWLDTRDKKIHQIASMEKTVEPLVDAIVDKSDSPKILLEEIKPTLVQRADPPQKILIEDKPEPRKKNPPQPKLTTPPRKSQQTTKQQGHQRQPDPKPKENEIPLKVETAPVLNLEAKIVEVEVVAAKSPEKSQEDAITENVEHISEEPEIKFNAKNEGERDHESGYQSTNGGSNDTIHSSSQSLDSSIVQNDFKEVANSTRNHDEDEIENEAGNPDEVAENEDDERRFLGLRLSTITTVTATALLGILLI